MDVNDIILLILGALLGLAGQYLISGTTPSAPLPRLNTWWGRWRARRSAELAQKELGRILREESELDDLRSSPERAILAALNNFFAFTMTIMVLISAGLLERAYNYLEIHVFNYLGTYLYSSPFIPNTIKYITSWRSPIEINVDFEITLFSVSCCILIPISFRFISRCIFITSRFFLEDDKKEMRSRIAAIEDRWGAEPGVKLALETLYGHYPHLKPYSPVRFLSEVEPDWTAPRTDSGSAGVSEGTQPPSAS